MFLSLRQQLKKDLRIWGVKPNKLMGQNFLISENVYNFLVAALNLEKTDTVIEVGPGFGYLTFKLANKAKKVIAIEKDKALFQFLIDKIKMAGIKNIELVNEDILKYNFKRKEFKNKKYKIVGNIPYYLTNFLLRKILGLGQFVPAIIVFTVQKEVARRICAKPPQMNLLALTVQFYSDVRILKKISRKNFWPTPKVDSAIIEIRPQEKFKNIANQDLFFKLLRKGFSQPRKKLINNLKGFIFDQNYWKKILILCKIKSNQRAETLSLEDWNKIYQIMIKKTNYEEREIK